jgi:hypothetical protein
MKILGDIIEIGSIYVQCWFLLRLMRVQLRLRNVM